MVATAFTADQTCKISGTRCAQPWSSDRDCTRLASRLDTPQPTRPILTVQPRDEASECKASFTTYDTEMCFRIPCIQACYGEVGVVFREHKTGEVLRHPYPFMNANIPYNGITCYRSGKRQRRGESETSGHPWVISCLKVWLRHEAHSGEHHKEDSADWWQILRNNHTHSNIGSHQLWRHGRPYRISRL